MGKSNLLNHVRLIYVNVECLDRLPSILRQQLAEILASLSELFVKPPVSPVLQKGKILRQFG